MIAREVLADLLAERVGLSDEVAQRVLDVLAEHPAQTGGWLREHADDQPMSLVDEATQRRLS